MRILHPAGQKKASFPPKSCVFEVDQANGTADVTQHMLSSNHHVETWCQRIWPQNAAKAKEERDFLAHCNSGSGRHPTQQTAGHAGLANEYVGSVHVASVGDPHPVWA